MITIKKTLAAGISAVVLICLIGSVQAFAAAKTAANNTPAEIERPLGEINRQPGGRLDRQDGFRKALTDEEKAWMEAVQSQYQEKMQAFTDSLSSEQKALYDAMMPEKTEKLEKPVDGQPPQKPDPSFVTEMKEKQEAFIDSLSESQKAAYDELFMRQGFNKAMRMPGDMPQEGFRRELTDEEKAQMETERLQREEKLQAFVDSLSSEQKALYDDMGSVKREKPAGGEQPIKPDENFIANMKEKQEAFVASLSETQKAAYDELFSKYRRTFTKPDGE